MTSNPESKSKPKIKEYEHQRTWTSNLQGKKKNEHHQIKEHEHHYNVSQSSIVIHAKRSTSKAVIVSKKLLRSTGKATWIANTTLLILAMPLIIEMDHDQQLTEIELQNASLLDTTATPKWVWLRETLLLLSFSIRVFEKFQAFFRDRDRERVFNLGSVSWLCFFSVFTIIIIIVSVLNYADYGVWFGYLFCKLMPTKLLVVIFDMLCWVFYVMLLFGG